MISVHSIFLSWTSPFWQIPVVSHHRQFEFKNSKTDGSFPAIIPGCFDMTGKVVFPWTSSNHSAETPLSSVHCRCFRVTIQAKAGSAIALPALDCHVMCSNLQAMRWKWIPRLGLLVNLHDSVKTKNFLLLEAISHFHFRKVQLGNVSL